MMPGRAQHRHHSAPDHARGTGHQHIHIPATAIPFPRIGFPGFICIVMRSSWRMARSSLVPRTGPWFAACVRVAGL
jgi:hypothetical protein